jgi:hypothetical protein
MVRSRTVTLVLLLAISAFAQPRQVKTGWWKGWRTATTTEMPRPILPAAWIEIYGISKGGCMQDIVDNHRHHFTISYQYPSPNGFECVERWCMLSVQPIDSIRVWGSDLWTTLRHSFGVVEWQVGRLVSCP